MMEPTRMLTSQKSILSTPHTYKLSPAICRQKEPEGDTDMDDSRREFLKAGAKMAAVAAVPESLHGLSARVIGANDRVRVGIVGLRGRGENHITAYGKLPNG